MSDMLSAVTRGRSSAWWSRETPFFYPLLVLCGLAGGLAAVGPLSALFVHSSIDYGEGWNAYWAAAAMGPEPLYARSHIFIANNYPPLSFYLTGLLGKLVGDNIFAGRLIATASTVAVAMLVAVIVRRAGAPLRWAMASAILFLAYDIIYFGQYVAVNNPQWLGQALMLAGLLPLLGAGDQPPTRRRIVCAAGIMVLAGLVKHNQFAIPLAVTVWLALGDKRALGTWVAAGVGWAVIACLSLFALFGAAVFFELLAFQRTTSLVNFVDGLDKMTCFFALVGVALVTAPMRHRDRCWQLFGLYAVFGLILGAIQRLGNGIYINAHFDALIALVILCGMALGKPAADRGAFPGRRLRSALLLFLTVPLALVTIPHVKRSLKTWREQPRTAAAWDAMIADVRKARGPVLCEVPAVCYWAGKPFTLDFFAYGQKLRTGESLAQLRAFVSARRPAMLILDPDYETQIHEGRLPAPFPGLMRRDYRIVRIVPENIEERVPNR